MSRFVVRNLPVAHCRHNNFVLVSGLLMQNPLVDSGLLANVSEANARNLQTIASLLADLLLCLNTPEDTRLLLYVVFLCCLVLFFFHFFGSLPKGRCCASLCSFFSPLSCFSLTLSVIQSSDFGEVSHVVFYQVYLL